MLRQFVKGKVGKAAAVALALAGVGLLAWQFTGTGASDAVANSRNRWFICTETGKAFQQELKVGMTLPVTSPYSGKPTGIEAELCFWTREGKAKEEPTPVLLNERVAKSGPTFCPDCGRLVVGLNPPPRLDSKAPPTQTEYAANQQKRNTDRAREGDDKGDSSVAAERITPGS